MLPKNSSCVEYYANKQAKCVAKEDRLRREKERAERLAAQDAAVNQRLAREEAERLAKREADRRAEYKRIYGSEYPSYSYSSRAVQATEPEFPQKVNRTMKESAYNKMVSSPNSNLRRPVKSPEMDLLGDDIIGNKSFGKIKAVEKVVRWSSSYV